MIFVKQSLPSGTLGRDNALMTIKNGDIDGHVKTGGVHIGCVACFDKGDGHFWKLGEDGCAQCGILALVALAQPKKIEPARFHAVEQVTLVWWCKTPRQTQAFAQIHLRLRFHAQNLVQAKMLLLEFLFQRKHGGAGILTSRFDRRQIEHSFLVWLRGLAHSIAALLQALGRFTCTRDLRIQTEYSVNRCARIYRDLPFLPGDIQVDGAEILSRRGLLWQKWYQRSEFPSRSEIVRGNCACCGSATNKIARVRNHWVRQNSCLDQLRCCKSAAVPNGSQRRI